MTSPSEESVNSAGAAAKKRGTSVAAFTGGFVGGFSERIGSWSALISETYASWLSVAIAAVAGALIYLLLSRLFAHNEGKKA
jgi:zinc transporter ZupT